MSESLSVLISTDNLGVALNKKLNIKKIINKNRIYITLESPTYKQYLQRLLSVSGKMY